MERLGGTGWGSFNGCQTGVAAEVCVCWRGGLLHLAPRLFTQQGVGVSGWVSGWMGGRGGVSGLLNSKWWEGGVKGVTL